jgi:Protein of unknown function (DUF1566)
MARSRVVIAIVAALAGCALACDALLGLGNYQEVACIFDCSTGSEDAGDASDAPMEASSAMLDASDAADALDASDGDAAEASLEFEGSVDGPPLTELWARWPMPNPDASAAPTIDGSPALPNLMAYDAGPEAGTAFDMVTGLTWSRTSIPESDFGMAADACASLGALWHVPTRIQLVSIIDFTQPVGSAKIDPVAFPGTPADLFWTSSQVPGDAATPLYWLVDLGTGLVQQTTAANYVLCVKEGP